MTCDTTHDLFSEYFDGGLHPSERTALEAHLQDCQTCTVEYQHFTESLKALHETRPLETTRVFLNNVKAAAAAHLDRKENYLRTTSESMTVVTPKADPRSFAAERRVSPVVPVALVAALALAAFGVGWMMSDRGRRRERAESLREIAQLRARPPERIVETTPVDLKKLMESKGLVEANGQWIDARMKADFDRGLVYLGGVRMTPAEAARELARKFPPEVQPPPPPVPVPTAEEILEKAGYARVNDITVPKAWVDRWAEGLVQVGVGEWRKPSEFKEEFIREHNLVEVRGKLMTREQAELIQAQQIVKAPEAATAMNDFTRALEGLQIGPPMHFRGVTVYPLLAAAPPAGDAPYAPLHASLGAGKVELTDQGGFFTVGVKNGMESDVLFLAGEILTGGRCARMVSEDTLVARGQSARLPVFCVEPGQWKAASDRFAKESGHYLAPPSMRRSAAWEQGQGALWALLSRSLGGRSGQADLFRKHADAIAEYRAYFSVLPDREAGAVGLAVGLGEALEMVELFPDHALFTAYFDRVLAGAALELLERPAGPAPRSAAPPFPNSTKGVKQFLESAFFCSYDPRDDGFTVRREDAPVGRVRLSAGTLHHALLFAGGAPEWERRAAYTIPRDKMKRALDDYEARMKPLGPSRKIAAIHDLASINAPDVILPVLVRHLAETDAGVRRAVIQELGSTADSRATDPLLQILTRSRQDLPIFAEAVRSLARLGDERCVDPLLKHLDAGEAEPTRIIVMGLPELLLQVRGRDSLERAVARLVGLFEASEGVVKGEGVLVDPVVKNLRPAEAQALMEAVRTTLRLVVGLEFTSAAGARKWWNDRESRDRFLKERTGK